MEQKTALVFGAGGLTGKHLLEQLLKSDNYKSIKVFSRKEQLYENTKIDQHIIDFEKLEKYSELINGDDLYCCLGTTVKNAGSQKATRVVDYDYPVKIAEIAEKNRVSSYIVISSVGASSGSMSFYLRSKGDMEKAIEKFSFSTKHSLRPAYLLGKRVETRIAEKIGLVFISAINWMMVGKLKRYKSIHAKDVAKAMVYLANNKHNDFVIQSDEIKILANRLY